MSRPDRRERLQNQILRALPSDVHRRLARRWAEVTLQPGERIDADDQAMPHVYFPMSGLIGIVMTTERGEVVDVGSIGSEGVTSVYRTCALSSTQMIVQVRSMTARQVSLRAFDEEMDRSGALRSLVYAYYRSFNRELVRAIACNRLHSIVQRYCRQLLQVCDRVGDDTVTLPQTAMAAMLGVNRPAVSLIAHRLKGMGAISYNRSVVTLIDRRRIEALACECYRGARRSPGRVPRLSRCG